MNNTVEMLLTKNIQESIATTIVFYKIPQFKPIKVTAVLVYMHTHICTYQRLVCTCVFVLVFVYYLARDVNIPQNTLQYSTGRFLCIFTVIYSW